MSATTLATIKTQILARIEEVTANPKPNYSVDGQTVSWGDYLTQLQNALDRCNAQINGETPYELHSRGFT